MIATINPKTSRLAGGMNIEITGSDLFLAPISSLLTTALVVDESVSGTITDNEGIDFLFLPQPIRVQE